MLDPIKLADKAIGLVDSKVYSTKENEADRTERLRIDNTSPFKLPHLIRPIAFIWALSLQTVLSVLAIWKAPDELLIILGSNTSILITIVGFYFNSRKQEKVIAKKASAAIVIEKEKAKQSRIEARREYRIRKRELNKK